MVSNLGMRSTLSWLSIIAIVFASTRPEAQAESSPDERLWQQLSKRCSSLYQEKRYGEAKEACQVALDAAKKAFGPEDLHVADALDELAAVHHLKKDYSDGEALYLEALATHENIHTAEHPASAKVLYDLAELYRDQGNLSEALEAHQRVLKIREKRLNPDDKDVEDSQQMVAYLLYAQGRYAEALPFYEQQLARVEKQGQINETTLLQSLETLMNTARQAGLYEHALKSAQRAKGIAETVYGPQHPATISYLNAQAWLTYMLGRLKEARQLYEELLVAQEKLYGDKHFALVETLDALAWLSMLEGRYEESVTRSRRALSIIESTRGTEDPSVPLHLNSIGSVLTLQGHMSEAAPLFQQALALREKLHGEHNPSLMGDVLNLAGILELQGKFLEAQQMYQRAIALLEKADGADAVQVAHVLNALAWSYLKGGQVADACQAYDQAAKILEKKPEASAFLATISVHQAQCQSAASSP